MISRFTKKIWIFVQSHRSCLKCIRVHFLLDHSITSSVLQNGLKKQKFIFAQSDCISTEQLALSVTGNRIAVSYAVEGADYVDGSWVQEETGKKT